MAESGRTDRNAELRPQIVGTYQPAEGSNDPADHPMGFAIALQYALDGAKELLFPGQDLGDAGKTFPVTIRFEATVTVRNPGAIGEYRAVVSVP